MKLLIFCTLMGLLSVGIFAETVNFEQQWKDFKSKFGKHYKTAEEEQYRMKVFRENLYKIAKHNENFEKKKVTWRAGINGWADMTLDELLKYCFGAYAFTPHRMSLPNIAR